ncbi:3'-5' exonuclease [Helicobacter cinaedi]|uniref:DNA polymerase III subunit epsilon n=1 Tax=Helicobacter cinaedi CCUG 18818 = ATCC BAA-847 TaxID=537971 RepID=A0AAI8MLZ4_9HELI|nr:3'-5' exonuclease [Helicobacter cinaedi]AWK61263.1 3'-5' exonuclease [Helicobacter cinaedi]EFR47183.1 exonuclease, DNA polymerase III, epsilon subunit family [Helicobacter cinaedi CCUG 18818 = ATCC BAA-847]QOQ90152.1 3'-5' exonuclease [Helicobacter cinaedi]QOQ96336.1 3'-5' exonuclease [Helicobacter cinaedi]BAM31696.1 DNA polymerase III subunit epsilon [Helicobacter cinaedi CCUG 18818 = ATCC BAA-847]
MTYTQLFEKLRQAPMSEKQFYMYVKNIGGLYADVDSEIELLKGAGGALHIEKQNGELCFTLATFFQAWQEGEFVFVDIETNGAKPQSSEIIEIGALRVKNSQILESFESYVYAPFVPENITELTGIRQEDIQNAPQSKEVLRAFREFLGGGVFVAHNVNFDFSFLDYHLRQNGLFGLLNPKLCTIDLAKKTILSKRYALSYLNEFLGINTAMSHRAYADALTSFRIFEIAISMLPLNVKSVQDLIDFSRGRFKR